MCENLGLSKFVLKMHEMSENELITIIHIANHGSPESITIIYLLQVINLFI